MLGVGDVVFFAPAKARAKTSISVGITEGHPIVMQWFGLGDIDLWCGSKKTSAR